MKRDMQIEILSKRPLLAVCTILGFLSLPMCTLAQSTPTVSDLQVLLVSLQTQLATLQQQRNTGQFTVVANIALPAGSSPLLRPLSIGISGADVSALQTFLRAQGHYTYPEITGYYGNATAQAVAAYQRANNLEAVGSVGPRTRALLNASLVSSGATSPSVSGIVAPTSSPIPGAVATNLTLSRPLALGTKGPDVSSLQVFLQSKGYYTYPEITGYYGNATAQAVAAYQRANNLEAVGMVGPKTMALLNTSFAQDRNDDPSSGHGNSTATSVHNGDTINSTPSSGGISVGDGSSSGGGSSNSGGSSSSATTPITSGANTGASVTQTPADTAPPTVTITGPVSSLAAGTASVVLTATTNEAATCRYSTVSSTVYVGMTAFTTSGGSVHTTTISPLSNGTTYVYYVKCQDTAGNTSNNASVTFSVTAVVADTTAPSTPVNIAGTAISTTQINLTWTASTDPSTGSGQTTSGVAGYKIYRDGAQVGTSATASYSDTGLAASTVYGYSVAAYDAASNVSAQSSVGAFITSGTVSSPVVAIGGRIVTTANLNVHSGAGIGAASTGSQPIGAGGVVLAGPTIVDGYTWWQVNYDTGVDGWSIGDYLAATPAVSAPAVGMSGYSPLIALAR